ncbi:hypothetical protein CBOM_03311 [Ceraceosorus bombacis]|uniref:Uncharacterized protein n=1 Tax=Ceraceosorus bombacis TaxID=401625 RepID=A0A0P1BMC4_9BASI|nr:hypothetical protein CBOM_03311 [Ceraceosorus bombacis]
MLCQLSKLHQLRYTPILYRAPELREAESVGLLRQTLASRPDLGRLIVALLVLGDACPAAPIARLFEDDPAPNNPRYRMAVHDYTTSSRSGCFGTMGSPTADRILQLCPNVRTLSIDRRFCWDWSPGLYALRRAREMTLLNVEGSHLFVGMHGCRRDVVPVPRPGETPTHEGVRRLHLTYFHKDCLPGLFTARSLTHLVLTYPQLPPLGPTGFMFPIIGRGAVMALLSATRSPDDSGQRTASTAPALQKLIIRADVASLAAIADELRPIDDERLRFRVIGKASSQRKVDVPDESGPLDLLKEHQANAVRSRRQVMFELAASGHLLSTTSTVGATGSGKARYEEWPVGHAAADDDDLPLAAPWKDEADDVLGATAQGFAWLDAQAKSLSNTGAGGAADAGSEPEQTLADDVAGLVIN